MAANRLADETDRLPIHQVDDLRRAVEAYLHSNSPAHLALLEIDANQMSPWYDAYGGGQRELAMNTFFEALTYLRIDRGYHGRLEFVGRHPYDKLLLRDVGNPKDLASIAGDLKRALDRVVIPNPDQLRPESRQHKGASVDVDPAHLTVRIGAAFQHGSYCPYDVGGLLQRALQAAEEAKAAPNQIVVVEYAPNPV